MNNNSVQQKIEECKEEIDRIENFIQDNGQAHNMVPFLTKYLVIRCCGTIENAFKNIISDYHSNIPLQARNYIENTFTNSSMNPSKDNICKILKKFDEAWNNRFKAKLLENSSQQLEDSLKSLNNNRNQFAHGGNPTASYNDIKRYFGDAIKIIELLDETINNNLEESINYEDNNSVNDG